MSLQTCSSGHDEVCFDDGTYGNRKSCPTCTAIEERDEAIKERDAAVERAESLETELDGLRGTIEALEAELKEKEG